MKCATRTRRSEVAAERRQFSCEPKEKVLKTREKVKTKQNKDVEIALKLYIEKKVKK